MHKMIAHTNGFKVGSTVLMISMLISAKAAAFSWPAKSSAPSVHQEINQDTDLVTLMRPMPQEEPEIYAQALQILTAMQDSPSCNRLAVSTLLTSCQAVDASASGAEASLDDVKSLYAAQLAVCEVTGAGSTIPVQCKSLTPVHQNGKKGFRGSDDAKRLRPGSREFDKDKLSVCLQLLESRPQWWTSYSNSRQNAGIVCRAARADVDKDDLIKLHKVMVETSSGANAALAQALRQANDHMLQQQDFTRAIKTFQEDLLGDLQKSGAKAQSYFSMLIKGFDSATRTMMIKITSTIENVENSITGLNEGVRATNSEMIDLEKNVGKVFQQVVQGSAELANSQTQHWDLNRGLAIELQNSLETIRGSEVNALLRAFESIHSQLLTSNELMSMIQFRQNAHDERLLGLDTAFGRLEDKAQALHTAQTLQAETQSSLHDQMQIEMQVAHGLLVDITSSAASLKTAVEDTSTKIAQMASLSGVTGSIIRWGWMGLLILVLYQFNPRLAGYLAAAFGAFLLLTTYGIFDMIGSLSPHPIFGHGVEHLHIPPYVLFAATAAIGVVAMLGVILHRFRKARVDLPSKLQFLETGGIGMSRQKHSGWTF